MRKFIQETDAILRELSFDSDADISYAQALETLGEDSVLPKEQWLIGELAQSDDYDISPWPQKLSATPEHFAKVLSHVLPRTQY